MDDVIEEYHRHVYWIITISTKKTDGLNDLCPTCLTLDWFEKKVVFVEFYSHVLQPYNGNNKMNQMLKSTEITLNWHFGGNK